MYKQKQWEEWLHEELEKPYMIKLVGDLEKEAYKMELAPLREYWFNSLQFSNIEAIHTVITDIAPYPEVVLSDGYAFSSYGDASPQMLKLYKKIYVDTGVKYDQSDNCKQRWVDQGILLLPIEFTINLTTKETETRWRPFTENILSYFLSDSQPRAYLFLDDSTSYCMSELFRKFDLSRHLIIRGDPYKLLRSKEDIFNRINHFVWEHYKKVIDWT